MNYSIRSCLRTKKVEKSMLKVCTKKPSSSAVRVQFVVRYSVLPVDCSFMDFYCRLTSLACHLHKVIATTEVLQYVSSLWMIETWKY